MVPLSSFKFIVNLNLILLIIWLAQTSHGFGAFSLSWIIPNPFSRSSLRTLMHAEEEKCYGDLGCLKNTDEWFDLLHRPISLFPQARDVINTRFFLFQRHDVANPVQIFKNSTHLLSNGFDPSKPIKIITHGFLDSGLSFWMVELAQALLAVGDFNVICIDWRAGALALYPQAAANTRLVALEIVNFVKFLQTEFSVVDAANVHCIGHSLGSHTCAYVGNGVTGLGRISGLDPAEPLFQYMPEIVRLSPDDGKFVDVIHTDSRTILLLGYGMIQPCGHMDFYPNDGKEQPGCEFTEKFMNVLKTRSLDEARRELFACDHHRAVHYFIQSILNQCQFVGHRCPDYASYLQGNCSSCGVNGSDCALMGLDADKYAIGNGSLVSFYLSTAKSSPFCGRNYLVTIKFARPPEAASWVQGKLQLSMTGSSANLTMFNLSNDEDLKVNHGTNMSFLVRATKELGTIEEVRLDWKYDHGLLEVSSTCWTVLLCNNRLFVQDIKVTDIDDLATWPIIIDPLVANVSKKRSTISDSDPIIVPPPAAAGAAAGSSLITFCGRNNKCGANYAEIYSGSFATFECST